jgi:hypothetical protein
MREILVGKRGEATLLHAKVIYSYCMACPLGLRAVVDHDSRLRSASTSICWMHKNGRTMEACVEQMILVMASTASRMEAMEAWKGWKRLKRDNI